MFLDYYGLREQPFGVTPDPRYLYLGASHREALASLFYGIMTGRGILTLVARPGMGKTTLLFHLLEHVGKSARTAFLFQTQCDSSGLLHYLLAALGVDAQKQECVTMHGRLNQLLLQEAAAGRKVVLVIDEAQNLDNHVLETARLLSDFETPREKLLQIVLVGQSQLAEKLERPEMAQLRQRIDIVARLEPFRTLEVTQYIEHRLRVAGYNGGQLFRPAAFEKIAQCSRGIPRNINNLCFNALSLGCAYKCKPIDGDLIHEAASDLDLGVLASQRRHEPIPVVCSAPAKSMPQVPVSHAHMPALSNFEPKRWLARGAIATPTLVLAFLMCILYWGNLRAAAARTRKTLTAASTSLFVHHSATRTDPERPTAAQTNEMTADGPELNIQGAALEAPPSEPTNAETMTDGGTSATPTLRDPAAATNALPGDSKAPAQKEFTGATTMVIVQPNDDLRKICLQYLGSYGPVLQSEISRLNPELTDPDHIAVGQLIVLPRPPGYRPHSSQ